MRFPRNAKMFRGQMDAAPFAGVFFLLTLFVLLASFTYTPGVRLRLPRQTCPEPTRPPWPWPSIPPDNFISKIS
jgi:hypothetical protein